MKVVFIIHFHVHNMYFTTVRTVTRKIQSTLSGQDQRNRGQGAYPSPPIFSKQLTLFSTRGGHIMPTVLLLQLPHPRIFIPSAGSAKDVRLYSIPFHHGLRMPNEAFFHWNPERLCLGIYILGHLGYFRPNCQHPFCCYNESHFHAFHYSTIISTKN